MVCVLNSWKFVSSSVTVISSSTPLLIVWSIFSPCMCVFLCGWVCMCVCVCECVWGHMFKIGNNIVWWFVAWFLYCGFTKPANMHLCWMPHPKACYTVCPFYLLMTLLCSSASALPSILFCLDSPSVSVSTYILIYAHLPFFYIFLTLPMYIFVSLLLWLLILQLCSLCTSLTWFFLTLLALTFLSPLPFPPFSCVNPHFIPFISSLCLSLLPPRSVVSQREPRELQPGVQQSSKQHRQWHEVPGATALEQHRLRQLQPHPPAARH